jgi:trimethylamine--corrinoid protein Co-methyltransferase
MRALTKNNLSHLIKMGAVVAGGKEQLKKRPVISILESSIAPLRFPDIFVEVLVVCGEYGIPVEICSVPNIGATGPITLAGALLLATVESLAAIVVSQVAHPGAPLIWAPRFPLMDMSTGHTGLLADGVIVSAAAAQLAAEHYNLISDLHGPATNSIIPDGESIFEESLCAYVTAFAGNPSILCGAGALELGLIASHEEMVVTDEIFAVLRRILEGIEVSDERLGADAIARVGIGGNYLTDAHTMKYLRSERYQSPFVKPKTRDSWISSGSKSFVQRAREKALAMLQEHQAAPLDEIIAAEVREVIHKAEKDNSVVSRK